MPLYDLMLMLDPNAPEARQAEILKDVRSQIEGGGELVGSHDWGVRRMAYEIEHHPDAAYTLLQFSGTPDLLSALDHNLKIADGVLRFRIIRQKEGAPPPPTPRAEPAKPRQEEGDVAVAPRAAADAPAPEDEEAPAAEAPAEEAPVEAAPAPAAPEAPAAPPAEAPSEPAQ